MYHSFYEPFYSDLFRYLSDRFPPPKYNGRKKQFENESYLCTAAEDVVELLVSFPDVNPAELIDMRWWTVCFLRERPKGISKAGREVLRAEAKVLEETENFITQHRFDYGVIL